MNRFAKVLLAAVVSSLPTPAGAQPRTDAVYTVSFSPDGKVFATGGLQENRPGGTVGYGEIMFWDVKTFKMQAKIVVGTQVVSVVYSPDGNTLASAEMHQSLAAIKLWDVKTRKERVALEKGIDPVALRTSSLAFSPDGKTLAAGCVEPGYASVLLWDVETGKRKKPLSRDTGFAEHAVAVAFRPDGKTLAAGTTGGTIQLWDLATGKLRETIKGHAKDIRGCVPSISPDGKVLASRAFDKTIKLWDLDTGKELGALPGDVQGMSDLAFSPDSKTLVSGGGATVSPDGMKAITQGGIHFWDVETRKVQTILKGDTDAVHVLALSPDGKALAVARGGSQIELWKLGLANPAPANKEADKAAAAKSAEEKAAELLAQAKETLKNKNVSLAKIRLRNIVSDYAKTPAAAEARVLLKSLEK